MRLDCIGRVVFSLIVGRFASFRMRWTPHSLVHSRQCPPGRASWATQGTADRLRPPACPSRRRVNIAAVLTASNLGLFSANTSDLPGVLRPSVVARERPQAKAYQTIPGARRRLHASWPTPRSACGTMCVGLEPARCRPLTHRPRRGMVNHSHPHCPCGERRRLPLGETTFPQRRSARRQKRTRAWSLRPIVASSVGPVAQCASTPSAASRLRRWRTRSTRAVTWRTRHQRRRSAASCGGPALPPVRVRVRSGPSGPDQAAGDDMDGWWCVRNGDALACVEASSSAAAVRRSLDLHPWGDWTDDVRELVVFPQVAYPDHAGPHDYTGPC